jgi:hypothetical protein
MSPVVRPAPVLVSSEHYFARLHDRLRERLPMWVVYHPHTIEYPGKWVARMHVGLPKPVVTRFVMTHDTLDALRDLLPPGLTNIGREEGDVPEIIEVWI